jgi:hypothetical protein
MRSQDKTEARARGPRALPRRRARARLDIDK